MVIPRTAVFRPPSWLFQGRPFVLVSGRPVMRPSPSKPCFSLLGDVATWQNARWACGGRVQLETDIKEPQIGWREDCERTEMGYVGRGGRYCVDRQICWISMRAMRAPWIDGRTRPVLLLALAFCRGAPWTQTGDLDLASNFRSANRRYCILRLCNTWGLARIVRCSSFRAPPHLTSF